jgi:hypothetical protein
MLRDLRRTFRTGLSRLGVAPHIAERLMHHISAADRIQLTYDRHTTSPNARGDAAVGRILEPSR